MGGAVHGVVLFSWGYSGFRPEKIPRDVLAQILEAFSQLRQRVIMKFDKALLLSVGVKIPPNVMVRSWVPQQDILGKKRQQITTF